MLPLGPQLFEGGAFGFLPLQLQQQQQWAAPPQQQEQQRRQRGLPQAGPVAANSIHLQPGPQQHQDAGGLLPCQLPPQLLSMQATAVLGAGQLPSDVPAQLSGLLPLSHWPGMGLPLPLPDNQGGAYQIRCLLQLADGSLAVPLIAPGAGGSGAAAAAAYAEEDEACGSA
jgi:hypothetical protein